MPLLNIVVVLAVVASTASGVVARTDLRMVSELNNARLLHRVRQKAAAATLARTQGAASHTAFASVTATMRTRDTSLSMDDGMFAEVDAMIAAGAEALVYNELDDGLKLKAYLYTMFRQDQDIAEEVRVAVYRAMMVTFFTVTSSHEAFQPSPANGRRAYGCIAAYVRTVMAVRKRSGHTIDVPTRDTPAYIKMNACVNSAMRLRVKPEESPLVPKSIHEVVDRAFRFSESVANIYNGWLDSSRISGGTTRKVYAHTSNYNFKQLLAKTTIAPDSQATCMSLSAGLQRLAMKELEEAQRIHAATSFVLGGLQVLAGAFVPGAGARAIGFAVAAGELMPSRLTRRLFPWKRAVAYRKMRSSVLMTARAVLDDDEDNDQRTCVEKLQLVFSYFVDAALAPDVLKFDPVRIKKDRGFLKLVLSQETPLLSPAAARLLKDAAIELGVDKALLSPDGVLAKLGTKLGVDKKHTRTVVSALRGLLSRRK